jgi:hypothetical protein
VLPQDALREGLDRAADAAETREPGPVVEPGQADDVLENLKGLLTCDESGLSMKAVNGQGRRKTWWVLGAGKDGSRDTRSS